MNLKQTILLHLGAAADLFTDPETIELIVNEDGTVWVDTLKASSVNTGIVLDPNDRQSIINCMADSMGEVATAERPYISAIMPKTNERFQGQMSPLVAAPTFSFRMPARRLLRLSDQVRMGTLTEADAEVLQKALKERRNIAIIGATGSGKTTFANSLLNEEIIYGDRHLIIQDLPELRTSAPNAVTFFTRASNPVISAQFLLFLALRNRPDRIHVGECRDGATLMELFKAWNTGHPGGLTTFHADSTEDALYRIEDLFAEVTTQVPRRQIARSLGLVVEIRKTPQGRRVTSIIENIRFDPAADRYVFDDARRA